MEKATNKNREAIIVLVGFLGAGKTTLLKRLMETFIQNHWEPFVILNDYENAYIDSQQLEDVEGSKSVNPLNGSCICCSGIHELRNYINLIQPREKGVTLIEANGTSDACSLMGFLGVGLNERFLPPVQVSVVDVLNWQRRGEYNELEANQIQVSSLVVFSHTAGVSQERIEKVKSHVLELNPKAQVVMFDEVNAVLLPLLNPSTNSPEELEHSKAHWSSCSVELPELYNEEEINRICEAIPNSILRVKGCAKIFGSEGFTFFERTPDMSISIRPFNGIPSVGSMLLTVGPGSEPEAIQQILESTLYKKV